MNESLQSILDFDLNPVSRRPLTLRPETVSGIFSLPVPTCPACNATSPATSVIVVTYNNEALTRLCLYSVLASTCDESFELIVVDNGSTDGSVSYLQSLAMKNAHVRLVLNQSNRGFAAANNQGLGIAQGAVVVLLNNDTVVSPGWLTRLTAPLRDQSIGIVGPATNRIGNEAEIETTYNTVREFIAEASVRADSLASSTFELPRPAMFCVAMRRDVVQQVGPLDERFERGLFEDDDYALRIVAAGLKTVGADDVLVHHFGEGTFGNLFTDGSHEELFRTNRQKFEAKWGVSWHAPRRRPSPTYAAALKRIAAVVSKRVPPNAPVVVISKGDEELLASIRDTGRPAVHFPQLPTGEYAGYHPADGGDATTQLAQVVRRTGAEYLFVPATSAWWMDFYPEMLGHLTSIASDIDIGILYKITDIESTTHTNGFDPTWHPIVFSTPRRLTAESFWVEHIPFAMYLVGLLRPRLIVELGSHAGDSYCAMCQAVLELGLQTQCHAIDTWQGDLHTGRYGSGVFEDLRAHHDPLYGEFSRLNPATFDDAVQSFADESIDLLHIDGTHTYEAVRHDFDTWHPKLSECAVVLFHDTNVRQKDFGVWRAWAELRQTYRGFEFSHGHGLGVLAVGRAIPAAAADLFNAMADPHHYRRLRRFFSKLGTCCLLQRNLNNADRLGKEG